MLAQPCVVANSKCHRDLARRMALFAPILICAACRFVDLDFASDQVPPSDVVVLECSDVCGTITTCDGARTHDLHNWNDGWVGVRVRQALLDPGCYNLEVLSHMALDPYPFDSDRFETVSGLQLKPGHRYRIDDTGARVVNITISDVTTGVEIYNSRWVE